MKDIQTKLLALTTGKTDFLILEHLISDAGILNIGRITPIDFSIEHSLNRSHISHTLAKLVGSGLLVPKGRVLYSTYDISGLKNRLAK